MEKTIELYLFRDGRAGFSLTYFNYQQAEQECNRLMAGLKELGVDLDSTWQGSLQGVSGLSMCG